MTRRLRLKILTAVIGFSPACPVHADSFVQSVQVLAQTGMYAFTAESPTKRKTSISGYGAHGVFAEFAMKDRFKLSAGLSFTLSSGFTGDTSTGYDVAGKYFFMSNASPKAIVYDTFTWYTRDVFRPYAGLAVRNREFFSVLSTTYVGMGVLAGIDYDLTRDLFLNSEVRYDFLRGNQDNSLVQINFLVGLGMFFD